MIIYAVKLMNGWVATVQYQFIEIEPGRFYFYFSIYTMIDQLEICI